MHLFFFIAHAVVISGFYLYALQDVLAVVGFSAEFKVNIQGGIMSLLSIACIVIGCYYAVIRFPLAVAPDKTVKLLKIFWRSETGTRIFGFAWFIPWLIVIYYTFQLETTVSKVLFIWGIIGSIISSYVVVFASSYSRQMKDVIQNITTPVRIFALLTAFLGLFLVYLGIMAF